MPQPIVISLFDFTCNMVAPWAEVGFLCYCVDLKHPARERREGNIVRVGANVAEWLPPYAAVKILFAFPPCTHVAASGARWFKDKGLGALTESLRLFDASVRLAEWTGAPYMIENPVSTVSSYWRKPDQTFHPCAYGGYLRPPSDAYTKRTCLWTGNDFVMPKAKPVKPIEGSKMHRLSPSNHRAAIRSATPEGFARAVFEANANRCSQKLKSSLGKN
ncbi:MAG TPA: hypothetical protein VNT99_01750 [Methylomirabilota bacterium]|nr:hypothetical protein [Methylomirabilota bacterium]